MTPRENMLSLYRRQGYEFAPVEFKITDDSARRAAAFARADVDIIQMGDDIGMQDAPMMSLEMYREWLKPRLAQVIAGAKGGLLVAPTRMVEPEVPWENVEAYVRACRDYT